MQNETVAGWMKQISENPAPPLAFDALIDYYESLDH
jgi:hypothetical protein